MRGLPAAALLGLFSANLLAQGTGLESLMPPLLPGAALSPASAAAAAAKAGKAKPAAPAPAANKTVLNGTVSLALAVGEKNVQTVRVKFAKVFPKAEQAQALAAAVAVQRDVGLSCGKLCKAARPAPPAIAADGTVSFEMVISGLDRTLSSLDMLALLEARPLAKTPAAPAAAASEPRP